jgi:hypothetical protein
MYAIQGRIAGLLILHPVSLPASEANIFDRQDEADLTH